MAVCPNKNTPEWKALVAKVGEFEAFRDFVENGDIRTPEEVQEKIDTRETTDPSYPESAIKGSDVPLESQDETTITGLGLKLDSISHEIDPITTDTARATEIANKLSNQLDVEYEIITPQQAEDLTKDALSPWNGEVAFFLGGRVYFIGNHLSVDTVFHEFGHPLIRSISKGDPRLFNNLYEQLFNTDEGVKIIDEVKQLYPELDSSSDLFKEEALVRTLEISAIQKIENVKPQSSFRKMVTNLLYAIKQLLRRTFGQNAAVSKLDASTTMDELTDMLVKGGNFQIEVEQVNQDDVAAYAREQEEYIKDLQKVKGAEIQALINRAYDISTKHIDTLMGRKEYDELAALLTDEYRRGDLQEIKSNLSQYQTIVANSVKDLQNDMEYSQKQVTALVNTLFRLETVMDKVLLHMEDISRGKDSVDNLHKAYYYTYLVDYWGNFMKEANDALNDREFGVPRNSPVAQLASDITRSISQIKNLANDMYAEGARDTLYQELEPIGESIGARYNQILDNLRKKGAPQERIDKVHRDYYGITEGQLKRMNELDGVRKAGQALTPDQMDELEQLKRDAGRGIAITPEKIELLLKGEMGDANFFNSYLEGYLHSTDPVVGGLALYVRNKMNDVMNIAQSKFNDFAGDMEPLLKEAGYNPIRIGDLGQKVGFIDKVAKRDEDGNLIERQVWTMLNNFKDYRFDQDMHKDRVEKAQLNYARTGTEEARQGLINAIAERKAFLRKYFHQEYVPEFYAREELFERDDVGKEAAYLRKGLFERMRMLTEPATTQTDYLEISDELDLLWREYRQMHSLYDMNGTKKTGKDLDISKRLRQYRDESRDFYEWKQRKGVFENALKSYEQELVDTNVDPESEQFTVLRNEWIKRNTRVVVKPEFYERRQQVLDRVKELMAQLPDQDRKAMDQSGVWENILDLSAGFRDDDGQPNASEMSEGSIAEVKRLQEQLDAMRNNYVQRNGLTRAESARLNELHQIKASQGQLSPLERTEMSDIYNKKTKYGLSKFDIAELDSLFEELQQLSKKEATEYYTDVFNNWLTKLDTDKLFLSAGSRAITRLGADKILDPALIDELLAQDEGFANWFKDNHILKTHYDREAGQEIAKWERLYVWNVNRPADDSYYETTDIRDAEGTVTDTIRGLPSMKYYVRVAKQEYRNRKIVGVNSDNRGQFLPKTLEQGAADDRYINHDYTKMRTENPALFGVLEKLKEHHLKNQEGLGYKSRLFLDFPRLRKSTLETVQTKTVKGVSDEGWNVLTIYAKRVKDFFRGAKDDAESGFNYKDEFNLVRADMFDNEVTSVPIAGLYDVDIQDVSTDITHSMMRYMMSGERQKQLVKISPVARAIQSVVNDPKNEIKQLDQVNKFNFVHRGLKTYMSKRGTSIREKAVNNFIEREFEGKTMAGAVKDVPWLNNTASLLFKRASFGFFAFNIPSALKNSYGAKFQGMLEASTGKWMNHASLQQGNAWSYGAMAEMSSNQIYRKGVKSLRQQIIDVFDPSQDRFEEKFGEGMSRTIAKDIGSFSWFYNFRKWVELQATFQIFGGMMFHQKVTQTQSDGTEREINYMDAWEVRDNKIQLKEGIDPAWGITYDEEGNIQTGDKFKRFKNTMQGVQRNLQGAYAKFDQPEAQRYLAFRFISYLRRYFTTMTLNRFGFSGRFWDPKPRFNPGLGDMHMGYYVQFLNTMKDTVVSLGRNIPYMTVEEKNGAIRAVTEGAMLASTVLAMSLLFGWDPDDDDKYEKLRERSGALPFPFVPEDPDRDFDGWGFAENHMLYLLMNIRAENEQFLPMPGFGLDDYTAMLDLKSIAFGPTIKTYKEIFEDAVDMMQGNERAYYKRQVGPYEWQHEGGKKIWAHLARTVGATGTSLDPAKGIKGFQSVQARAR